MKKLKVLTSAFLVMVLLSNLISVSAYSTVDLKSSSKFDIGLEKIVDRLNSDDIIQVAIWFPEINLRTKKTMILKALDDAEKGGSTSSDYEKISNGEFVLDNKSDGISISTYNSYIGIARKAVCQLYEQYTNNISNTVFARHASQPEIVYTSKYTPSIIVNISKANLKKIEYDSDICSIYYHPEYNPEDLEYEDESESISYNTNDRSNYGYWQNNTNIFVLRDGFGYTGTGINIGLLENRLPDLSADVFDSLVSQNRYLLLGNTSVTNDVHAQKMAAIMVGETNDYKGVAPNANLICSDLSLGIEESIDNLVSHGANIINVSIGIGWTSTLVYGHYAKYFDCVISNSWVTICKSSGNYVLNSTTEMYDSAFSYNSITVGNIDDHQTLSTSDDTIDSISLYYDGFLLSYKPDISAPGKNAVHPLSTSSNGGTSSATAMVSGICALLMQAFTTLKLHPMLLKSALISSATVLDNMTDIYSNSTSIYPAFDRPYGAGMVDAINAYLLLYNGQYKNVTSITDMETTVNELTLHIYNKDISKSRDIYACVSWMQDVVDVYDDYSNLYVQPGYHHELRLYDPNNTLVARSSYTYDRKQFIRFTPTQSGDYVLKVYKTGVPYYDPKSAITYYVK